MIKDKDSLKACLDNIAKICVRLDFFSDPNIEKKLAESDSNCGGIEWYNYEVNTICKDILENPSAEWQDLLGEEGLQVIHKLSSVIGESMHAYCCITMDYSHYKRGFSKSVDWDVFVEDIDEINIFLKDILRKHGRLIK